MALAALVLSGCSLLLAPPSVGPSPDAAPADADADETTPPADADAEAAPDGGPDADRDAAPDSESPDSAPDVGPDPCGPGGCDDGCACSVDTCDEAAGVCRHDFSPCTMSLTVPASAVKSVTPATVTVDVGCAGQAASIVCTAGPARLCFHGPEQFEGGTGGFSALAGSVTHSTCGGVAEDDRWIPGRGGVGCFDEAGEGILRLARNSTAALVLVDARGFAGIQVHFKAGISFEADSGEYVSTRACCSAAEECRAEIGRAYNSDQDPCPDLCSDAWAWRGPFAPTPAEALDGCSEVRVNLRWSASASNEIVHVDNFCISGVGTLALPLTDNGDGSYRVPLSAAEAGRVEVSCSWSHRAGTVSRSAEVVFD